jgi:hypothetical protein
MRRRIGHNGSTGLMMARFNAGLAVGFTTGIFRRTAFASAMMLERGQLLHATL